LLKSFKDVRTLSLFQRGAVVAFGSRGESGLAEGGGMVGIGGVRGANMPPPRAMPGGGPPSGMFGAQSGKKYNLTLSVSAWNALNRANYSPPNGDLSSPF
jgi:hypothetical protein